MSQTFVMVLTRLWLRRAEKGVFRAFYFPLSRTLTDTHTHITEEGKSPCQGQECECFALSLSGGVPRFFMLFGLFLIQSSKSKKHLQAMFLPSLFSVKCFSCSFFNDAIKLGIWTVWGDFTKQLHHFVCCILPQKMFLLFTNNPQSSLSRHYWHCSALCKL